MCASLLVHTKFSWMKFDRATWNASKRKCDCKFYRAFFYIYEHTHSNTYHFWWLTKQQQQQYEIWIGCVVFCMLLVCAIYEVKPKQIQIHIPIVCSSMCSVNVVCRTQSKWWWWWWWKEVFMRVRWYTKFCHTYYFIHTILVYASWSHIWQTDTHPIQGSLFVTQKDKNHFLLANVLCVR